MMKLTTVKSLTLSCLGAALFVATLFVAPTTSIAQQTQESAHGQGTLLVLNEEGNAVRRQFSFSARRLADGRVKGSAVLHNPAFKGEKGQYINYKLILLA